MSLETSLKFRVWCFSKKYLDNIWFFAATTMFVFVSLLGSLHNPLFFLFGLFSFILLAFFVFKIDNLKFRDIDDFTFLLEMISENNQKEIEHQLNKLENGNCHKLIKDELKRIKKMHPELFV